MSLSLITLLWGGLPSSLARYILMTLEMVPDWQWMETRTLTCLLAVPVHILSWSRTVGGLWIWDSNTQLEWCA